MSLNETNNNFTNWKSKFFIITSGQTVSLVGSSAVQFAIIWWLASSSDSPMIMAFAGLMAFLPQVILGPFAGVWVDRLNRKAVVIAADMFMGIAALVFAGIFLVTEPPFWSACIVLAVRGVGGVFHQPAISAIVPTLVPADKLMKANGWSQFMMSGAFMLGPVFGAFMYGFLPMYIILLTDFVGAVIANITVAIVKLPHTPPNRENPHFLREMKNGFKVLLSDKRLLLLLIGSGVAMIFMLPMSTYYPLMTSSYFELGAYYAGIVELVFAVGMMVFSAIIGLFGTVKRKILMAYIGLFGYGLTAFLSGILPASMSGYWSFVVICFFMGGSGNIYNIPMTAYMQENLPQKSLGRVFSLIGAISSATLPIGLLISGPVAEKYGVITWFAVSGIACIIVTVVSVIIDRIKFKEEI